MMYEPTQQDLEDMELVYSIRAMEDGITLLKKKLLQNQPEQTEEERHD